MLKLPSRLRCSLMRVNPWWELSLFEIATIRNQRSLFWISWSVYNRYWLSMRILWIGRVELPVVQGYPIGVICYDTMGARHWRERFSGWVIH